MRRQTIDEIKTRLDVISPNVEVISDFYEGDGSRISCRCKIDGYEWSAIWNSLQRGTGCPKCGGRLRLTIEEVKEKIFLISPTIEVISENYIRVKDKLDVRCTVCGYEWKATTSALFLGGGCHACANVARLTLEQVKEKLKEICPTISILSTTYKNAKEKLDVHCEVCGHDWKSIWDNLSHRKTCPNCSLEKRSGANSSWWKGGVSPIKEYLRGAVLQWRKDSARNCNYRCVISGERFNDIHHAYNFSSIMYETFDICGISIKQKVIDYTDQELLELSIVCLHLHYEYGLGKCLTHDLHMEYHSLYGRENNTLKQFEEFVELKKRERELTHGNLQ